jgi:hypothetical protein
MKFFGKKYSGSKPQQIDNGYNRDKAADRLNEAFVDGKLPVDGSLQRLDPKAKELERQATIARGVC